MDSLNFPPDSPPRFPPADESGGIFSPAKWGKNCPNFAEMMNCMENKKMQKNGKFDFSKLK